MRKLHVWWRSSGIQWWWWCWWWHYTNWWWWFVYHALLSDPNSKWRLLHHCNYLHIPKLEPSSATYLPILIITKKYITMDPFIQLNASQHETEYINVCELIFLLVEYMCHKYKYIYINIQRIRMFVRWSYSTWSKCLLHPSLCPTSANTEHSVMACQIYIY